MPDRPEPLPADFREAFARTRSTGRLSRLGSPILYFPVTGSTNDVVSRLAAHGQAEGVVAMADAQTAGRGRRGRQWFSPPGSGLYMSVLLAPGRATVPDRATALVTLAAGVALAEAVETATGLGPGIKWPNDLLIGRRKLAGILADGIVGQAPPASRPSVSQVVLGYGINVGSTAYPRDLADRATSLELELGRTIDRAMLAAESLAAIERRYDDLLLGHFDAILDAWRARWANRTGARVSWDTPAGPRSGVTEDIDEWGGLLVRSEGRVERIVAGDVRWE